MNCPHCNHPNLDDARYCARCGKEFAPQPPLHETVTPEFTAPPQELVQHVEFAGFWLRFVAAIIDGLIVFAVNWFFTLLMKDNKAGSFVVSTIIGWMYFALQESSNRQATFGKLALGLAVTDTSHRRISFARATGRHFAKMISAIILFIGFIMVAFTEKKQGLHDMLADTLVVKGNHLRLFVLASGSKANSVLLRDGDTRILIDAGLGIRKLLEAMESIGEHPRHLSAIFITHEHADHTRGLNRLLPHASVRVFGSAGTLSCLEDKVPAKQSLIDINGGTVEVGPFMVRAIPVSHDAAEPTAYHIVTNHERITIATDLGEVSAELTDALMHSTCTVLESNHDERLLENGSYPQILKDRIRSCMGHLSNRQTAEALTACRDNGLRHVILAHISDENNDPALALSTAKRALKDTDTEVYLTAQRTMGPFIELT